MKVENKIIAASIALGVLVWLIDAVLDTFLFPEGVFWDHLFSVPKHEILIRSVASTVIIISGVVVASLWARREKAEDSMRASEERYRLLLQNANDAVFVHGISEEGPGRFFEVNDQACRLLGYTRDELLQMGVFDIDVPENKSNLTAIMEQLSRNGHAIFETELVAKGGSRVPVEVSVSQFELQGVPAVLAAVRDISERKEAERERERLETQLLQAQRMESIGRLAGGVAHDFNNMLSVILGHADMAAEQTGPAHPVSRDLKEINSAAERSSALVRQLLAFARRQTAKPRILDLNDTVAGMLKMLRRLIGEEIDLIWRPGTDLWRIKMDPAQIDQILMNLCLNARDAIDGVGTISIETENVVLDQAYCSGHAEFIPGRYAMLVVSDDGGGMDQTTLENLFDPFFTTKAFGEGSGLGLSMVYGIVKQNYGCINVYSEPGQGTTFKIYFPETEEAVQPEDKQLSGPVEQGTETVLVVEDEASILQLGKIMLERFGYTVLAAGTPEEALVTARGFEGSIDLLLTDVVLPDMNGKLLQEKIEECQPGIKTLFMSGYTSNVIMHRGILEQDVHLLQKPFTVSSLTSKVREVLDGE